jgi:ribosome-interacting GTPase 1
MPANLPPQYHEVERRYRAARTLEEKVATLEELLGTIPKHKGTDHLRADLRSKLAKLKNATQAHKGATRQESAFHLEREGAGRAVLVGSTNVGKSALVAALTHARPEVSEHPYTTWLPTPGMMPCGDIQIQLVDTPPLTREHVEPGLVDLVRSADLLLLVVDLQAAPDRQLAESLEVLEEHRIAPAPWRDRYPESARLAFRRVLVVVNKDDDETLDEDAEIFGQLLPEPWPLVPVSATTGHNLERLRQAVYEALEIMRIYTKPPGREADRTRPYVVAQGTTVVGFAAEVHQDFAAHLKSARVWGSGLFPGQAVGRDHVLRDGDVVELHL